MITSSNLAARSAALTDRGRRRSNQDAVLVARLADGRILAAVADGMGGHQSGEEASRRALDALRAALESGADLVWAVQAANAAVLEAAESEPDYAGMGTTLVALLQAGATYEIANVGDSRAYRVTEDGIRQVTRDHSFVAEAIASGELSPGDAQASRWRNAVTRAVGTGAELEVDHHGPFGTREPHAVVLCSDGLYRTLSDEDIRRLALAAEGPAEAVRAMAVAAFEAGSDDNISVAMIRFGHTGAAGTMQPANRSHPILMLEPERGLRARSRGLLLGTGPAGPRPLLPALLGALLGTVALAAALYFFVLD